MDTSFRWKLLILILVLGTAVWQLLPSVQLYSMPKEERSDAAHNVLRDKSLALGLDLLGGADLTLEIDRPDTSSITDEEIPELLDRAMAVLRNRIDGFGVAEPSIQKQGKERINVQLPGLTDINRAKEIIGKTAKLEFKIVEEGDRSITTLRRLDRVIVEALRAGGSDSSSVSNQPLTDRLFGFPQLSVYGGAMISSVEDSARIAEYLAVIDSTAIPRDLQVVFSSEREQHSTGVRGPVLYVLEEKVLLGGETIKSAEMRFDLDQTRPGAPGVSITFDQRGTGAFRRITGANVGRQLAIVLDDKVYSAPNIRQRIPSGNCSITGSFTDQESSDLALVLRAGALPVDLKFVEERTVGPSLGSDSIQAGMLAAAVGGIAVVLFMSIYYNWCGWIAIGGLTLNIVLLLAGLAALRATLTLPGIAGVVLTVGMAVDANVLIFERIREELRSGKRVRAAIESGYDRAFRTILDANLTTLISAIVLMNFGTGPVKGFAVTLAIGIVANLYTAVVVTRMSFDTITARRAVKKLYI